MATVLLIALSLFSEKMNAKRSNAEMKPGSLVKGLQRCQDHCMQRMKWINGLNALLHIAQHQLFWHRYFSSDRAGLNSNLHLELHDHLGISDKGEIVKPKQQPAPALGLGCCLCESVFNSLSLEQDFNSLRQNSSRLRRSVWPAFQIECLVDGWNNLVGGNGRINQVICNITFIHGDLSVLG